MTTRTVAAEQEARVLALLPTIARWCARLGGPGVDAQEASHDVALTVLRTAPALDEDAALYAYTYAVTRNVVANRRRLVWWRRWVPGASVERAQLATPLAALEVRETAERVGACLDALPLIHREVLVLCDVEERPASEVAMLLGVPEGTVRSRLRLARARFRALAPRYHLHGPDGEDP